MINKQLITEGVKYMLISTLCFTFMQGLIKYLPQDRIPTIEQTFFRSVITAVFCIFFMVKNRISFRVKNPKMIVTRSLLGSISMFAFFYILPRMPLGSSVTIKYLSPVFTALFAIVLLKEAIKPLQWLYILMAFMGVVLLKGFDNRIALVDLGIGLISAVTAGLLYIILRKMGDDDPPIVVVFYFMAIACFISAVFMMPYWVTPDLNDSLVFLGVGYSGYVAQIYMTKAFQQKEDANYLAQFKYLEAVFAIITGFLWFGETYTFMSFLGIVLIFMSLILTVRLKSQVIINDEL
jgi:drug/metabolite transporter (DMT)-like permease